MFLSPCLMVSDCFCDMGFVCPNTKRGGAVLNHTLSNFQLIIATPFTQAGYVGEDVEMVIHRLLQVSSCQDALRDQEPGITETEERF